MIRFQAQNRTKPITLSVIYSFLSVFSLLLIVPACYSNENTSQLQASKSADNQRQKYHYDALVYDGDAAAFGDGDAIGEILDSKGFTYQRASSDELNQMALEDYSQYGMLIWPGGYAGQMSSSLTASTRETIRKAVNDLGVSYVGICAGAFIAVSPPTLPGKDGPKWGLSILPAKDLLPYYHLEDEGTEDAMVDLTLEGGKSRSLVWWGGPTLPEYPQGVIARYSDTQDPAIIETMAGKGFVILSGPHPEAPESWRTQLGLSDADGLDYEIAGSLFEAALSRKPLPTVN